MSVGSDLEAYNASEHQEALVRVLMRRAGYNGLTSMQGALEYTSISTNEVMNKHNYANVCL
jgi:hypothetical protein